MKLWMTISMAVGLALTLTSVINMGPITQNAYAGVSPSNSSPASGGSLGQQQQSGSNVGGVDPGVFCITGVKTPICK